MSVEESPPEDLPDHELRFRGMADVMDVGVTAVDRNGEFTYFNAKATELTGLGQTQIPPEEWAKAFGIYYPDGVTVFPMEELPLIRALSGETVHGVEMILDNPLLNGRRSVAVSAFPLKDARGGAVAVFQDVDERVERRRKLEESNRQLEDFAHVASHDLQEPLRKITSFVGLLSEEFRGKLGEEADMFMDTSVDAARRMQVLIREVLQLARLKQETAEKAPVDMEVLVREVLENCAFEDKDVDISVGELPTVVGDAAQLRRLCQNLLTNAVKFRGADPPSVRIDAIRDGDRWRFGVHDNGIGIPSRYREQVFLVFKRLHAQSQYDGTGVGLAICSRIVTSHEGRIWVEESDMGGTSVLFTLAAERMRHPGT
ncbi:MAG: PAS domain-containing protein [Nannocystaceae bacterium]|nr:PAS domain-containing protein [Nannocystaceae bacterium]